MKKIGLIGVILLFSLKCTDQPTTINGSAQKEIDEFLAYMGKPALSIQLSNQNISVDDSIEIGSDRIIVKNVHWAEKDSTMLNDSGWIACHDLVHTSCYGKFRFFRKDIVTNIQYPEFLCLEYQYKSKEIFDTVYLNSIASFYDGMKLSTNDENGKFEHVFLWSNELIVNTKMEIKHMSIAIDNGLFGAEYYQSFPNIGNYKDGESTPPEGYKYWHSAFSPSDNYFNFKSEQDLAPFVRINICVKAYSEYDIRILVSKKF